LALLSGAFAAHAAMTAKTVAPAAAATSAVAKNNPIPRPAESDPTIERIVTAMNDASTWGHPDLFGEFAGVRLYSEGDYTSAIKYFKYGARYADKLSQLSIGLMYANGQGVAKDPVTACAWLALAAQRKYPSFVATRDRVCEALTPAQHGQAVAVLGKLLPVYGDKVAKKRMAHALELAQSEMTGSRLGFDSGVSQVVARRDCGGPTVDVAGVSVPKAGCGDMNFYDPSRWNPKQYFAARDARWRAVVTVGALQNQGSPASSASAGQAKRDGRPTPASSPGH
jgi:hypothetical protein